MALRERVADPVAERAVLAALRARRGVATRADLIVDTSLPESTVSAALERLLDRYASAMRLEKGALVYRFAPGFRRRPERRPALRAALDAIWRTGRSVGRAVRTGFRIVLAVQLVTYLAIVLLPVSVIVGVVIGIGLLIAGLLSDSGVAEILFEPWALAIVFGLCVAVGIGWAVKQKVGLLLRLLGARDEDPDGGRLDDLVGRVDGFALGPPASVRRSERIDRTWRISRADERRVLARIRAKGGVLRAGDLVAWLALGLDEADAQATRLAVEYGGDPSAAPEEPVLELTFPTLLATAGSAGKDAVRADEPTSVERADPPAPFTPNEPTHDLAVAGFAIVNLIAGWVTLAAVTPRLGDHWGWRLGWLAAWPAIVCSSLLIGLALLRVPGWLYVRGRATVRRTRSRVVGAIVAHARRRSGKGVDLATLARALPRDASLPALTGGQLRAIALELGGEHDVDDVEDPTRTIWRFPRLEHELAGRAGKARR